MCKQLKEKLLQALMDNMGSVIDTLDEHAKSIKELERRISQLSAKGSGAERNKHIEFSMKHRKQLQRPLKKLKRL